MLRAVREAQQIYIGNGGEMSPYLIGAYRVEGATLMTIGRPAEALPILQKALDISRSVEGPRSSSTVRLVTEVAMAHIGSGSPKAGLAMLQPVFATADLDTLEDDVLTGLHESYARALLETGEPAKAIEIVELGLKKGADRGCCEESVPQMQAVLARARWMMTPKDPEVRDALANAVRKMEATNSPELIDSIRQARAWLEEMG